MQQCEEAKLDAVLISYDFLKAFDMVEWDSIYTTLQAFGFREHYIKMMKVLFTDQVAYTANNGRWSTPITPTRGCRQGCCFSPKIFIYVVELLGLAIRQNEDIQGIKINGNLIKSGQFADDFWTTTPASQESINATLTEIIEFQKFSGLKLNYEKCAVLRLGPFKNSDAKFYTMKQLFWSDGPIKILGYYLYPDRKTMIYENYEKTFIKAKNIIENWKQRDQTLFGKVVVINSLINSMFAHLLATLPSPPLSFFLSYRKLITDYLWSDRPVRIKYERLIQDYNDLGLKLIDLQAKEWSMKGAIPCKWYDRQKDELAWFYKGLPINDHRLWYCNVSSRDIKTFYYNPHSLSSNQDIWFAWSKINYQENVDTLQDILQQNVWGNSHIRVGNQPIFDKKNYWKQMLRKYFIFMTQWQRTS